MYRTFAYVGFCIALTTSPLSAAQPIVVELFTSQGCSSCPQADAFLSELAKTPDLLVLSEHVDYWDYLGWKDPFASAENTRRQRDYARRLGLSYVYTPQMVVHGQRQASGSDRLSVLQLIYEAQAVPSIGVRVDRGDDGAWIARLAKAPIPGTADVWLVRFDPARLTRVSKGENGGRKIENTNVVREFRRLGVWNGDALSLTVPQATPAAEESRAILVQQTDTGRILGAARLDSGQH